MNMCLPAQHKDVLAKMQILVLYQPPLLSQQAVWYSTFPELNLPLKEAHFESLEQIQSNMVIVLKGLEEIYFQQCVQT